MPASAHGEVSSECLGAFRVFSERYAGDPEAVFAHDRAYFAAPPARLPWAKVVRLYQRVEGMLPPGTPLEVCGVTIFENPGLGRMMRALSVLTSPSRLIFLGNRFGLERTFSHLEVEQTLRPDGSVDLVIDIPDAYEDCPQFFRVTAGVLQAFPRLIGLPDAEVDLDLRPRRGIYRVVPPPSRTMFARLNRFLAWLIGADGLVEELTKQRLELNARVRELRALNGELTSALSARDRFLEVVSHELLTPLNGLSGSLAGLEGLEPDRSEVARDLQASVLRLEMGVGDLLEQARARDGLIVPDLEPVALPEVLEDAIGRHRAFAREKGLDFEIDVRGIPRSVRGDRPRLIRVLTHLVHNAVKFTEEGKVRVDATFVDGELRVTVEDTGPGIDERDLERVFEAFRQIEGHAQRRHTGFGLGLALAKAIIDALGGTLALTSELGRGTRFDVRIPLEVLAVPASRAPVDATQPVLIVDDDAVNRRVLGRALERLGLGVVTAPDGAAGVEVVRSTPLALVIMDYEMPVMDGVEATRRIRAEHPDLLVLGWSASARKEVRREMRAAGANAFLDKPMNPKRLGASLAEHGVAPPSPAREEESPPPPASTAAPRE